MVRRWVQRDRETQLRRVFRSPGSSPCSVTARSHHNHAGPRSHDHPAGNRSGHFRPSRIARTANYPRHRCNDPRKPNPARGHQHQVVAGLAVGELVEPLRGELPFVEFRPFVTLLRRSSSRSPCPGWKSDHGGVAFTEKVMFGTGASEERLIDGVRARTATGRTARYWFRS